MRISKSREVTPLTVLGASNSCSTTSLALKERHEGNTSRGYGLKGSQLTPIHVAKSRLETPRKATCQPASETRGWVHQPLQLHLPGHSKAWQRASQRASGSQRQLGKDTGLGGSPLNDHCTRLPPHPLKPPQQQLPIALKLKSLIFNKP